MTGGASSAGQMHGEGLCLFITALLIPRDCVQEGCLAPAEREEGPAPRRCPPCLGTWEALSSAGL